MQVLISRTEEMLLVLVCRLHEDAYGLTIRKEMEGLTGRRYSVGGIYVPLDRLVRKGLLKTEEGQATPERLGRPRRRYRITPEGLAQLRAARALHEALWASLPELVRHTLSVA